MGGPHDLKLPEDTPWLRDQVIQSLCDAFETSGQPIFFVGGCVRNALLQTDMSDVDFATPARPEVSMRIAEAAGFKVIPTGIDHGTVTVARDAQAFEITTFRQDVETDGRHAVVRFSTELADDARRRDFTMNALYADRRGVIYDPVDGIADLNARRVRFIDDPRDRIREDYLRILRFFRFSAWYADASSGFDPETLAAIAELAAGIEGLSRERIGAEMLKLLAAPDPVPALAAMAQCYALSHVMPGATITMLGPLQHLEEMTATPVDPLRRLAALGGDDPVARLRLSKAQAKSLVAMKEGQGTGLSDRALGYRYGVETAWSILLLMAAVASQPMDRTRYAVVAEGAKAVFPIRAADLPPTLEGAEIGAELRRFEQDWFNSDLRATKTDLLG